MAFFRIERADPTKPLTSAEHEVAFGPYTKVVADRLKAEGRLIVEAEREAMPLRPCPACQKNGITRRG